MAKIRPTLRHTVKWDDLLPKPATKAVIFITQDPRQTTLT